MEKNRLNLDFSLETATDRRNFVNSYTQRDEFKDKPLTDKELEKIANYLLYGKDEKGETPVSRGEIQIDTKNKTWTAGPQIQSLDLLRDKDEGPGLDETQILRPYQQHYKNVREVFSREEALNKSPDDLKPLFEDLFKRIDEIELAINYYDMLHNKREKPPRPELLKRLSEEQIAIAQKHGETWTQFVYLKNKHRLVELRREQYTLRDSYQTRIKREPANHGAPIMEESVFTFDFDAPVFPLGLKNESEVARLMFQDYEKLNPTSFTEKQLEGISKLYWEKEKLEKTSQVFFDFREIEHVYQLFQNYFELKDCYLNDEIGSTTNFLFKTLEFYIEQAELSEAQKEILQLKINKVKNSDIAATINKKYGKTYTANYISTIFRQKIIKKINEAAVFHKKIVENLFFEEEFKKCTSCGKIFLICSENFVKKSRSKDGYTNRCKTCDRLDRQKKKEN